MARPNQKRRSENIPVTIATMMQQIRIPYFPVPILLAQIRQITGGKTRLDFSSNVWFVKRCYEYIFCEIGAPR
jgi:hypothetical protein